jgi:hypothetical protein
VWLYIAVAAAAVVVIVNVIVVLAFVRHGRELDEDVSTD